MLFFSKVGTQKIKTKKESEIKNIYNVCGLCYVIDIFVVSGFIFV